MEHRDIFQKLSPMSPLSPILTITDRNGKTETAISVMSYAVGGMISHLTEKEQIMMKNARDAQHSADIQQTRQFDEMLMKIIATTIDRKYEIPFYKKALLHTGDQAIQYRYPNPVISQFIEKTLTTKRHNLYLAEHDKQKPGNVAQKQYMIYQLTFMVFAKLRDLLTSGGDDLKRYEGKTLDQIAMMLNIPPFRLNDFQQHAVRIANNGDVSQLDRLAISPPVDADREHILFLANTASVRDTEMSIIPHWLQIHYAQEYNDTKAERQNSPQRMCEAFASAVLRKKGVETDSSFFTEQKIEFCDQSTPSFKKELYEKWMNNQSPFEMNSEMRRLTETFLSSTALQPSLPTTATDAEIADWFYTTHASNPYQNKDDHVNIDHESDEQIHSLNHVLHKKSAWDMITHDVMVEIREPLRRQQIIDLQNEQMSNRQMELQEMRNLQMKIQTQRDPRQLKKLQMELQEMRKQMTEIKSVADLTKMANKSIETYFNNASIDQLYVHYRDFGKVIVMKRMEKALRFVYSIHNRAYETLQRLLITATPSQIGRVCKDTDAADLLLSFRDDLRMKLQPFSTNELNSMLKKKGMYRANPDFSDDDKKWLMEQMEDLLKGINLFRSYLNKKDAYINIDAKNVMFIIGMYGNCLVKDGIQMVDVEHMPKEFQKLVTFPLENGALQQVWSYMIALYDARVLLRKKLEDHGKRLEDPAVIKRIVSRFAKDFIENDKRIQPVTFKRNDSDSEMKTRLLNAIGLTFVSIISQLYQFWKTSKMPNKPFRLTMDELEFVYELLGGVTYGTDDKYGSEIRELMQELSKKWNGNEMVGFDINQKVGHMVMELYNNQNDMLYQRLSQFIQFEDEKVVEKEEDEDDVVLVLDEAERDDEAPDDDQPDDGQFDKDDQEYGNDDDDREYVSDHDDDDADD
jgi:hypothetical protein